MSGHYDNGTPPGASNVGAQGEATADSNCYEIPVRANTDVYYLTPVDKDNTDNVDTSAPSKVLYDSLGEANTDEHVYNRAQPTIDNGDGKATDDNSAVLMSRQQQMVLCFVILLVVLMTILLGVSVHGVSTRKDLKMYDCDSVFVQHAERLVATLNIDVDILDADLEHIKDAVKTIHINKAVELSGQTCYLCKGAPGLSTRDGEPWFPGEPGRPGEDGQPGEHWVSGRPGVQGEKGERGDTGPSGNTGFGGLPGRPGLSGLVGPSGQMGPKGYPWSA